MARWDRFIAMLGGTAQRRYARLTISMSLVIAAGLTAECLITLFDGGQPPVGYALIAAALVIAAALARGGQTPIAATILVCAIFALPFVAIITGFSEGQEDRSVLLIAYTSVSIIVVYLFFDLRYTMVVVLANLAAIMLVTGSLMRLDTEETFLSVGVVASVAVLITLAAVSRQRDRLQIEDKTEALIDNETRYRALFSAAFETILFHDNSRVVDINAAGEAMFGYTKDQIIGKHLSELLTETLNMTTIQFWSSGDVVPFESVGLHREGRAFPVEVRDITYRKQIERRLQRQVELEKLIASISQRFANVSSTSLREALEEALGEAGDFMDAHSGSLVFFLVGQEMVVQTYGWTRQPSTRTLAALGHEMFSRFDWFMDQVASGEFFLFSSLSELPPQAEPEREFLSAQGIEGLIAQPFAIIGATGYVGFAMTKGAPPWPPEAQVLLDVFAKLVVNVFNRVQAEEALRRSEGLFSTVFHASPLGIAITGLAHGELLDANTSYLQLIGYARAEVIGRPAPHTGLWANAQERAALLQTIRQQDSMRNIEHDLIDRHGQARRVLTSLELIEIDGQQCLLSLTADITESKRAQEAAQAHELAWALEREQVAILQRFIGDVSHDLKTPLSVMRTSLYLIDRKLAKPNPAEHHLEVVDHQVSIMHRLLEDLLTMSRLDRITSGDFQFQEHDINSIVGAAVERQLALLQDKQQMLEYFPGEGLPSIPVDVVAVSRAINNLILNAITYTPAGGLIHVRTMRDGDAVRIEVQDNGIGISEEDLPHIFQRFFRADKSRPNRVAGAGLGLSITRRIIEAHQGRIEATSALGVGSLFTIWLPIQRTGGLPEDR
jgi:PAS domain S-box-containing protein